jgi:hypothetical protein
MRSHLKTCPAADGRGGFKITQAKKNRAATGVPDTHSLPDNREEALRA